MSGTFAVLVGRDLRLAARRRIDAALPIAFFTVAISLFPLGVGPEPQMLRQIAPGVVWVAALLASLDEWLAPYLDGNDPGYSTFKTAMSTREARVYVGANDGMLHAVKDDVDAAKVGLDPATGSRLSTRVQGRPVAVPLDPKALVEKPESVVNDPVSLVDVAPTIASWNASFVAADRVCVCPLQQ